MTYRIERDIDPTASINALARIMLESPDALELIESLATLMNDEHFIMLCDKLDICPEHLTDIDSCYDDELSCRPDPDA